MGEKEKEEGGERERGEEERERERERIERRERAEEREKSNFKMSNKQSNLLSEIGLQHHFRQYRIFIFIPSFV